jgi:hypothetical protein
MTSAIRLYERRRKAPKQVALRVRADALQVMLIVSLADDHSWLDFRVNVRAVALTVAQFG